MTTIPTVLSDLADRLEKFRPMQPPEGDDPRYWTLDLQLAAALLGHDKEIHDALQLSESVDFASAFKERFDRLYELAKSDDPNALDRLAEMLFDLTLYCRSLAEAIGAKFRDNPPWNVPRKILVGRHSVAGEQPAEQPPEVAPGLDDIPQLDKESGEWVLAPRASELTGSETSTLSNDRTAPDAIRSDDKCKGIDRRGRMWRKERELSQNTWYYVPSLSYKSS